MPGIALGDVDRACRVARVAVRPVNLLAQDRALIEAQEEGSLRVGQVVGRSGTIERSDQVSGQGVVVQLAMLCLCLLWHTTYHFKEKDNPNKIQ